ncbi:hypothetical protein PAECIP111892_03109 [Paenibacillus auburnensis]|uniref:HTH tetR-type domain-containing protein n=1 Tax=Paenibacillus auburnensis TaxID=2905649 RepID=A0ABM9CBU6_9BACL|nr:TetR/AcrR family transcriptional regulator [Paenibacillus auburnensis]CAH1208436.1 hypothetical protein PAECIP111892_03109 [Paenibacillus auburnensis]
MNNDDRRIRKTKKALREALAELMMNKELRSITIQELSDTADVHRATFYAHYRDIYDLYEQLEEAMVNEMGAIIIHDPTHTYDELFKSVIDYVIENSKMCRMFLKNHTFHERISEFLEEKYFDIWKYETGEVMVTDEWEFLANYHIQGCLAIVTRWAENDYIYPKEKITDMILRIDNHFDEILT